MWTAPFSFSTEIRHLLVLLVARVAPYAFLCLVSSRAAATDRIVVVSAYGATVWGLFQVGGAHVLPWLVLAAAYYGAVAASLNMVARALSARNLTRGAVFVVLAYAFMFLPGLLFPEVARPLFMALAWNGLLAGYSYCVETCHWKADRPPLRNRLFFLFVNPLLVYSMAGVPGLPKRPMRREGLFRAFQGVILLLMAHSGTQFVANLRTVRPEVVSPGAALIARGTVSLLLIYAAHSGLAHLQIGLMRTLGWLVPERYDRPLLASSPMQFWTRWNTYVRMWLEKYVFMPLGISLARKVGEAWGGIVGLSATLVVSGLMHDALALAQYQVTSLRYLSLFTGMGLVVMMWFGSRRFLARLRERAQVVAAAIDLAVPIASRAAMVVLLICAGLHLE